MKYIFLLFIIILPVYVTAQDDFGYVDPSTTINWNDDIYNDFFDNMASSTKAASGPLYSRFQSNV